MIVTPERYSAHNEIFGFTNDEIERVIDIAEQVVENATCGKTRNFESFSHDVKEKVIKAICTQTEFILKNYGTDMDTVIPESASIGSFSYSVGGSKEARASPTTLNHFARLYLQSAGLLYRGGVHVTY